MAFKYRSRDTSTLEKRSSQQGGDFKGFIADDFRTYQPKKGDNWIRILPPTWDDPEHYGMDVWVHYGIGPDRASAVCIAKQPHPITGEKGHCPLCEARAAAERAGDEELAAELKPARRVMVWILDRKDEAQGPLIWAMPWTLDRDICKVSRDKRTGEVYVIDHPDNGYDVMFDRDGDGMNVKYVGLQIARRSSSVDQDSLDFVEGAPLPLTMLWRDYDELKELYDGSGMANKSERPARDARPSRDERPARDDDRRGSRDRDPPPRDRREERGADRPEARGGGRDRESAATRESLREDDAYLRGEKDADPRQPPREEEPPFDRAPPPREEPIARRPVGRRPVEEPPARDDPPAREAPAREDPPPASTSGQSRAEALRARFGSKK